MEGVFFLGGKEQQTLAKEIAACFRGKVSVGGGADLCFLSGPSILVLGDSLPDHPVILSRGVTVVLESTNLPGAEFLTGQDVMVITCGTDPRATLSLASLQEGRAIVSLQRRIWDLSGRQLETGDLSVCLSKERSFFSILVFCALCLLLGEDSDRWPSF